MHISPQFQNHVRNEMRRNGKRMAKQAIRSASRSTYKTTQFLGDAWWKWSTTDHTGMTEAMNYMPRGLGFFGSIKYTLYHFCISLIAGIVMAAGYAILFAFILPNLLVFALKALFGQL